MSDRTLLLLLVITLVGGCSESDSDEVRRQQSAGFVTMQGTDPFGPDGNPTPQEIEQGRYDDSWKRVLEADTAAMQVNTADESSQPAAASNPETWEDIAPARVNDQSMQLPLSGDVAGPSVLRVQVLLDRMQFSPGILDGRWGKNTEKAVYWMQKREGLRATGRVDSSTYRRLRHLAGNPEQVIEQHRLTAEEVAGPFVDIPDDIYEKAKMDCMCYESLTEQLSEIFHLTPDLLAQLNPNVDLNRLEAGETIWVPNLVRPDSSTAPPISQIVVSDGGHYLHARQGDSLVYHFPSTLGSSYQPSPDGRFEVSLIERNPWWYYQPDLLGDVPDSLRPAKIPPGPNNAVGKVWLDLSKPNYGIHGTSAPATIGYVTSAGCVRLTNWDAVFLAQRIEKGVPVRFIDSRQRGQGESTGGAQTARATGPAAP